jgi:hypothetical protein
MALQGNCREAAGSIWHLTGSEQMQNRSTAHPSRNTMSDEFVCLQYITPSAARLSIRMQLNNWLGGMCTVHESVRMSPAFQLPTTVSYYSIILQYHQFPLTPWNSAWNETDPILNRILIRIIFFRVNVEFYDPSKSHLGKGQMQGRLLALCHLTPSESFLLWEIGCQFRDWSVSHTSRKMDG